MMLRLLMLLLLLLLLLYVLAQHAFDMKSHIFSTAAAAVYCEKIRACCIDKRCKASYDNAFVVCCV
jgi:hypothetical protein